jgi:hypothetical protein
MAPDWVTFIISSTLTHKVEELFVAEDSLIDGARLGYVRARRAGKSNHCAQNPAHSVRVRQKDAQFVQLAVVQLGQLVALHATLWIINE